MNDGDVERVTAWLIGRGLLGVPETELLHGFCEQAVSAGLPLSRAIALIDTLHPVYEGRAFRWRNDCVAEDSLFEYGRTNEGEAAANWRRSAFHRLLVTGADELRRRIGFGDPADFATLDTMQAEGHTDYLALVHRFAGSGIIGEMDCFYSSWATRHPDGFGDADLAALRRLVPPLALAIKCGSLARIADTLVEVYLGRDAGPRVLGGRIVRGAAERIAAVLCFSISGATRALPTAPRPSRSFRC